MTLPSREQLFERFRDVSLERLGHIEAAWLALAQGDGGERTADEVRRQLLTLKGEAAFLTISPIVQLCEKVEDLFELATDRGRFELGEEVALLMTAAIQLASVLLRAPDQDAPNEAELGEFVARVEQCVGRAQKQPAEFPRPTGADGAPTDHDERLTSATRERIAVGAVTAFIEHWNAFGDSSRRRLRNLWLLLADELGRLGGIQPAPLEVHTFHCPGIPVALAVAAEWEAWAEPRQRSAAIIQLDRVLGFVRPRAARHDEPTALFRFVRDGHDIRVGGTGRLGRSIAIRVCPTSDAHPVEVVSIDGSEALLLRPDLATEPSEVSLGRRNPLATGRGGRRLLLRAAISHPSGGFIGTAMGTSGQALFVRTEAPLPPGAQVRVVVSFADLLAPREVGARVSSRHLASCPGEPAGLLLRIDPDDALTELLHPPHDPGTPPAGTIYRILVVDARPLARAALATAAHRYSRRRGLDIRVIGVATAALARVRLAVERYDLAIIDSCLSDEPGEQLLAWLRAQPESSAPPALAMCREGSRREQDLLAAGADFILAEPLPLRDLCYTLDYLLCRKGT